MKQRERKRLKTLISDSIEWGGNNRPQYREVEQLVAFKPHKFEVTGSNPVPATTEKITPCLGV